MVPLLAKSRSLGNNNHGYSEKERDDVHDGVNIGAVHIFRLVPLQGLGDRTSELSLECSGKISKRGISEGSNIDIDTLALFDAGKADATNNGDKHDIGQHGLDVHGRNDKANDGGKYGLAGLNNLSKTDSTHSHGKDRSSMSNASEQTNGDAGSNISSGKVRRLTKAGCPHGGTPYHTDNKLGSGDEPMSMDHVGSLLVVDIVHRVARIPGHNKQDQLECRSRGGSLSGGGHCCCSRIVRKMGGRDGNWRKPEE
mmetsp:Transcript_33074/g.66700  ORF Transcript_33074/g.66700 Transcript_33074/m.66700 type:complete len:254 (+) Transcript_33074:317-1078(+)